jgi:hypothetical protein
MKVIDQHPSPVICSPQLIFEMEVCGSVAIFHKLGDFILFFVFPHCTVQYQGAVVLMNPKCHSPVESCFGDTNSTSFFFTIMHAAQIQYMAHTLHHHACALAIPFSCAQISIHLRLVLII